MFDSCLIEWGYDCVCCNNGDKAWELYQDQKFDIVLSAWILPGITGPELCANIREYEKGDYTYFILCTQKRDTKDIVEGIEAGADEYIIKPFEQAVLKVRLEAGRRLLRLEHSLSATNNRLRVGLEQAAATLTSMLPAPRIGPDLQIDWLFRPCAYIGGDLFNVFALDEKRVSLYSIDVSGHGVASALFAMTIGNMLLPRRRISALNNSRDASQFAWNASPVRVASTLNERFPLELPTNMYFTLFYGVIDLNDMSMRWVRAGHPSPILLSDGRSNLLDDGDPPIGLFSDYEFTEYTTQLKRSDRLFLYSDGITEANNSETVMFGAGKLTSLLSELSQRPLSDVVKYVDQKMLAYHGDDQFDDDLSLLAIEVI
jgi:sigma-B regulation protein RsbU (phosphoserine phosphatase)